MRNRLHNTYDLGMSKGFGVVQREVLAALDLLQNGYNRAAWFTLRDLGLVDLGSTPARTRSVRRAVDELVRAQRVERAYTLVRAVSESSVPLRRRPGSKVEMRRAICIRLSCTDRQAEEAHLAEWVQYMTQHAQKFDEIDHSSERALRTWAELDAGRGVLPRSFRPPRQ